MDKHYYLGSVCLDRKSEFKNVARILNPFLCNLRNSSTCLDHSLTVLVIAEVSVHCSIAHAIEGLGGLLLINAQDGVPMQSEARPTEFEIKKFTNGVLIKLKTLTETYSARVDVSLQGLLVPTSMPHIALVIPVLIECYKINDPERPLDTRI